MVLWKILLSSDDRICYRNTGKQKFLFTLQSANPKIYGDKSMLGKGLQIIVEMTYHV